MADDDKPDKPELRVIEGGGLRPRSVQELAVVHTLRVLTANLLRVTAGGGKPWEIPEQAIMFAQAMYAYQGKTGTWPNLSANLRGPVMAVDFNLESTRFVRRYEQNQAIGGALRIAASRLLGQRTPERRGENQMLDYIAAWLPEQPMEDSHEAQQDG
jgi:hypothetical protein